MTIDENWAVSHGRIEEFFIDTVGAKKDGETLRSSSCEIRLEAVEALMLGRWPTVRTHIVMTGPEEELRPMYRRFFLRFVSAGG